MESVTTTIYGSYIQTCQLLDVTPTIPPNSTLNQKFSIHDGETLNPGEIPRLEYIAIGNGGHGLNTGVNGISFNTPFLHTPRDAALYNQLPFVLRTTTDDLTLAERAKYRLRKEVSINGVSYIAYYLRKLEVTGLVPAMEYKVVADGVITTAPFTPAPADLEPVPNTIDPGTTTGTNGEYLASTAKVPFIMTEADMLELQNVSTIIYGSIDYAIVSEVALCTGVERTLSGNFSGSTLDYQEAVAVQVSVFISTLYAAKFINGTIDMVLDVGAVEPLQVG